MYERYGFLLHHTGIQSLRLKLKDALITRIIDVKNHDWAIPGEIYEGFLEACSDFLQPWMVELTDLSFRAPALLRNDYRHGKGVRWEANPLSRSSFRAWRLNPSGDPWTSVMAKIAGIVYGTFLFWINGDVVTDTDIEAMWKGQKPFGFLDAGDNLTFFDKRPHSWMYNNDWTAGLYFALLEDAETMIGAVPVGGGGVPLDFWPNPMSWVKGFFLADKGVDHPERRYAAYGYLHGSNEYYGAYPYYSELKEIADRAGEVVFGRTVTAMFESVYREPPSIGSRKLNWAETRVLMEPDYYIWGAVDEDVRDSIAEEFFLMYTPDDYAELALVALR